MKFDGLLDRQIRHSLLHWNNGVVPYSAFVEMFKTGRTTFAQGEMWGKAVRSGAMFYRYTPDPNLKAALSATVRDLLTTRRPNGTISCSEVSKQPDGPMGDLWERKYVLLGLDEYYEHVERDPVVLKAMVDLADATIAQIGPPPKTRIVDQGWSPNHIESSTILEPIMRLHKRTGHARYLDFARYIVEEEGGAKGYRIIDDCIANKDPYLIGGPYPKAYEMMSLFEGVLEYYRATGDERWRTATLNLFDNVRRKEITIVGNGGGDQPFHPAVLGEAWDNTAYEQTHPKMDRMMETCVGVTWLKLCGHVNRLTGSPAAIDEIEKYTYNALLGAMKPEGDGFAYVNRLNGIKTDPRGWGGTIGGVYVTCCNLNGPMGLACLPYLAAMRSPDGPVLNLYNAGRMSCATPSGRACALRVETDYPVSGQVRVRVGLQKTEAFSIRLRIPAWSKATTLTINGAVAKAEPGTYAELKRKWRDGDKIELGLDMRCRVVPALKGSSPGSDRYVALVRGPVVLARDENIDSNYRDPVTVLSRDGFAECKMISTDANTGRMEFAVPTATGSIRVVNYAGVNNWNGKRICTWLPMEGDKR